MGPRSVWVDDEARESAVLVGVPAVHLPAVQLDEDFIPHVQVQDDTVAGIRPTDWLISLLPRLYAERHH